MSASSGAEGLLPIARALESTEPNVFWLDAGPEAVDGTSYVGSGRRVLEARSGVVSLDGEPVGHDTLDTLRVVLGGGRSGPVTCPAGGPAFRGGWVGVLGYAYGATLVGVPADGGDLPDALFVDCERLWALDHATGRIDHLLGADVDLERDIDVGIDIDVAARHARSTPRVPSEPPVMPTSHWRHDRESYLRAISSCLASIAAGDAYQICLTNEVRVTTSADPFEVFLRLRTENAAPYGSFLRIGEVAIAGCSPERFLAVSADGHVETRPIKGTRRRDPDPLVDAALAVELRADEKERAENLMIVDLMRNDLGRVAELGTVEVPDLFAVESYPSVHQLVSTVTARLADGRSGIDAVRASFPAGSMTGAPKHRAMSILDSLEGGPRGLYSGAVGWFGLDGALDLAMVIRTVVFAGGEARIGTGGGITALSDPAREVEETLLKARPLLAALGAPATLPDAAP